MGDRPPDPEIEAAAQPSDAARRLGSLLSPFRRFFRLQSAGGTVLLLATVVAIAWANSPFAGSYTRLWERHFVIGLPPYVLDKTLIHWINDGLMAVFFLLVGLEIKRAVLAGELSDRRRATLPVVAAIGGMVVPALIFIGVTRGTPVASAWGIPMATDIAFALGALAILGTRLPASLRIFLAAAAIVDDIGAVIVIALVYTPTVGWVALGVAGLATLALFVLNRSGVSAIAPYVLVGIVLWLAMLKSGVHATIAGVILAFTIPARATSRTGPEETTSPLVKLEHALVTWVSFGIIPLFALANAGVRVEGDVAAALTTPLSVGIILGLFVGKQIGLLLFPWLAIRLKLTQLPAGASWAHMWGVSLLAGIGFTMSLFVAGLALPVDDLADAKLSILVASTLAATAGLLVLARPPRVAVQA